MKLSTFNLKNKTFKILHITLFAILISALILTNYFMNAGIRSQSKYIDYLVLLDFYEKLSEEYTQYTIKYTVLGDQEALESYKYLSNNKIRNNIIDQLYQLGITDREEQYIKKTIELCDKLRTKELEAINSKSQIVNLLSMQLDTTESEFMTDTYVSLSQQYKQTMIKLRNAITSRMSDEVTIKTSPLNKGFFIMTVIALFVPILVFNNLYKSQKLNRIIAEDRELQAATLKNIADGVIVVDTKGNIVLFNPAAEKITGFSVTKALGANINKVVDFMGDSKDFSLCKYNEVNSEINCPIKCSIDKPLRLTSSNNEEKIVEVKCSKIKTANEVTGVVYTLRDETEKVRIQDEMEKAKRLESLGLLAGGIAHDFNNTLTVIIGNLGLAKLYEYQGNTERIAYCLDEIDKETSKAQHITKQILTFARGGLPVKEVQSLYRIIKEASDSVFKNTTIDHAIVAPLADIKVDVDYGQMLHAFKNIFNNSLESFGCGAGKVSVNIIKSTTCDENEAINIIIKDNGTGIKEEDLPKIFDIYFTTKEGSQGLGLATTYKVITNHDGAIEAESKDGETIFTITLPIACKHKIKKKIQKPTNIIKSILVMDDEESITSVMTKYLTEYNYTVDTASNGETAIEKYKEKLQQGKTYDLVILDLTVPKGMGGEETMKELLKIDPNTKAIVASGYSNDTVLANYKDYGFQAILTKPYKPEDLIKTIKTL
ncbi:response regulator [Alkalicella caledoniensis]|uniref:Stage 0 sporulation protein A homolog n=1 Tax=Alkalicella caledoniensis TaxID=2731377 RepID=A0A7G9W429_ALKCA|nr:response regulator [Alkalicella caledoniensis]QNO13441.1 response regulator [Alkalicella caledoniensis]